MKVNDYLNFICGAESLEQLWDGHVRQMAKYGFDRMIYGYTRNKTETSLGDPDDFVILSNHDSEYLNGFLHAGLYFHAPMLRWALKNEGAGSWKIVQEMEAKGDLTSQGRKVLEFNQKLGLHAGYTVSFYSTSERYKGAISLAAKPGMSQEQVDAVWDKCGSDIVLMNNVAHLKILTLPYATPKRSLTGVCSG